MAVLKAKVIHQAKKKSATRGRRSCYPRPPVALLAAAGSVTRGRRSCYSRPRVDDIVKDFWNPQCCFPIIKVLLGIKQYIYVGCSKSKKIKVCKEAPAPLKGRVNFLRYPLSSKPNDFMPLIARKNQGSTPMPLLK